jgi:hypothetical protein
MADIFLSYKREDQKLAKDLAQQLISHGWSVWWDRNIPAGKAFDEVIEEELGKAKCVIVLWTALSVNSTNVKEEAWAGLGRKILIPVAIGNVTPPYGFKMIQTVFWNDNDLVEEFELTELLAQIQQMLSGKAASTDQRQEAPTHHTTSPQSVSEPSSPGPAVKASTARLTFSFPNKMASIYESVIPSVYNKAIKPITVAVNIYVDGREVGKLSVNESFSVDIEAGRHQLQLKRLGSTGAKGELVLLPGDHLGIKVGTNLTGIKFSQSVEH